MAAVGDRAPDFTLQGVDSFRITSFTLSEQLRESDFVVLSFYISVPLLCDTAQRVAEAYDVLQAEFDGFERVPRRSVFLVDDDRRVQVRWVAGDNWEEWSNEPLREIKTTIQEGRVDD